MGDLVARLRKALVEYDRAVEWHSYRRHDVDREAEQHKAAARLAEIVREALISQLTQHTEPVAGEVEDGWLLIKRGLYWRPDAQGYTGLKREAGRYDEQEAKFRCDNPDVRMVRASDAADYSPSCGYEARCRDLEQRLLAYDALDAAKDAEIERLTFSLEKRIDACISYQSQRDALREAIQQAREHFTVEYRADGIAQSVSHDSEALRKIVSILDAALKDEGGARP